MTGISYTIPTSTGWNAVKILKNGQAATLVAPWTYEN